MLACTDSVQAVAVVTVYTLVMAQSVPGLVNTQHPTNILSLGLEVVSLGLRIKYLTPDTPGI